MKRRLYPLLVLVALGLVVYWLITKGAIDFVMVLLVLALLFAAIHWLAKQLS